MSDPYPYDPYPVPNLTGSLNSTTTLFIAVWT
jgi:hypothetical protein